MRIIPFLIIIAVALVFLIARTRTESLNQTRQAQEEVQEVDRDNGKIHTLKVSYFARTPQDAPVADIIWMKKAADVALDSVTPYFNILKQKINYEFNSKYQMDLPIVHGIIQLENDPMRAEYDAHEIEGLILSNSP
jgi:hypothetical protein